MLSLLLLDFHPVLNVVKTPEFRPPTLRINNKECQDLRILPNPAVDSVGKLVTGNAINGVGHNAVSHHWLRMTKHSGFRCRMTA
jgi:hypothetical protein